MKVQWGSSSYPISDIRDWSNNGRLEIQPDFQRKEVWNKSAKIFLIDTILRNIPMPKIFLQAVIRAQDTYRVVIDGQQRLTAILGYLRDEYALEAPCDASYIGKKFSELTSEDQDAILNYKIDVNEIRNANAQMVNDIYSRVNKYTVQLNKQELRRADFPGAFLNLSEELAGIEFFDENRVFTVANSKRMGDVEYTSELLAMLLSGPQEKKETLDDFYQRFARWNEDDQAAVKSRFLEVVSDLKKIWGASADEDGLKCFQKTRFRQKADLYALFNVIDDFHAAGYSLGDKCLEFLRKDLALLDALIEPESGISLFQRYAIQCVSQSNTIGSRRWRRNVLKAFMSGTYIASAPSAGIVREFHNVLLEGGELRNKKCPICQQDHVVPSGLTSAHVTVGWAPGAQSFHFSNLWLIHQGDCLREARGSGYITGFDYQTGSFNESEFDEEDR